jgi:hypothetical protein
MQSGDVQRLQGTLEQINTNITQRFVNVEKRLMQVEQVTNQLLASAARWDQTSDNSSTLVTTAQFHAATQQFETTQQQMWGEFQVCVYARVGARTYFLRCHHPLHSFLSFCMLSFSFLLLPLHFFFSLTLSLSFYFPFSLSVSLSHTLPLSLAYRKRGVTLSLFAALRQRNISWLKSWLPCKNSLPAKWIVLRSHC